LGERHQSPCQGNLETTTVQQFIVSNQIFFARYVIATGAGENIWSILKCLLELKNGPE
jgi:hypothetical protein